MKQVLIFTIALFTITISAQSKEKLCKKWYLEGYIYLGKTYAPEDKERNDFIDFKIDNTFTNIDEGVVGKGTWRWDVENEMIYLNDGYSKKELPMKLIKISDNQLIILLREGESSIKVKFKTRNEKENRRD